MRNALLTIAFCSACALAATGASAQTSFPMSAEPAEYVTPMVGVELTGLMQEGRSAFSPPAEDIFGFADFSLPLDSQTMPSEQ